MFHHGDSTPKDALSSYGLATHMNKLVSGSVRDAGRAQAHRLPLLILGLLPVSYDVGGGSFIVWIIHAENHVFLKV